MDSLPQVQLDQSPSLMDESILFWIGNLSVAFRRPNSLFGKKESSIRAVDNTSFELHESEFLSLVGESGSGKTTVARCMMKFATPTSGSIQYKGMDITRLHGKALIKYRREVQMVFQDPYGSLNPRHDVFRTISDPIYRLTGERNPQFVKRMVTDLLEEVGMDPGEVMHRLPHELSGGQRQRVNIARALAPNPKVLIADEPITMLDAAQRLNILSLLVDLKSKRNLSILMITHDLASARITSDRIIIMYLGKIVELGPTKEILSKPHHPYVELILESTPQLGSSTQFVDETNSLSWIEESEGLPAGCICRPRCRSATGICKTDEPQLKGKSQFHTFACHNPLNSQDNGKS